MSTLSNNGKIENLIKSSERVLICKCSLLCNDLLSTFPWWHIYATTLSPPLLWYGLVNSTEGLNNSLCLRAYKFIIYYGPFSKIPASFWVSKAKTKNMWVDLVARQIQCLKVPIYIFYFFYLQLELAIRIYSQYISVQFEVTHFTVVTTCMLKLQYGG
jgi:hypothetical protein